MRTSALLLLVAFSLTTAAAAATSPSDGIPVEEPADGPSPEERDPLRHELGEGRIIAGHSAHRTLHFTFDDGPSRSHTLALLDLLDTYGVHATFFLVARRLEHRDERAIALEIARRGHTIGLHSYAHDHVAVMSASDLNADLDRSEALFVETFGAAPVLFRPPYGHHSDRSDEVLASRGYTQVLWNLHGGDVTARSADDVVATFSSMLERGESDARGGGGVVLLHDTHAWTIAAFPRLMEEIATRNCAALAADEELWDVAPDLAPWHQARGGASATRSARRMRLEDEAFEARQATLREEASARCSA